MNTLSGYKVLYHIKENDKTTINIVKDINNSEILCHKMLNQYNIDAFRYLKDNPHKNLAKIFKLCEEDGVLHVFEEYLRGENLEYILEEKKLSKWEKLRVADGVCDALIHLHNANKPIIHRDVKASNVMVCFDGRIVLTDYDSAKIFDASKNKDTQLIGTVGYAAPEQYGFFQSNPQTDIYALGILLKQMFANDFRIKKIADKAAAFSPKDRYVCVEEVKEGLHETRKLFPSNEKQTNLEYFCTNCNATLNDQPGFFYNDGTWICTECNQQLYGYEGDYGDNLRGVIWYCDGCGDILNKQEGFDYYDDSFVCKKCGYLNDITENNIIVSKPVK